MGEADYRAWRYQQDLPDDKENLAQAFQLLESYSKIPASEVEAHVRAVRDKAWAVFPYACIGRWRFLDLYLVSTPLYPDILERIKAGDVFLDAGCCFGQVLRQLVHDGAPAANLIGADLRQEFIDLGYDLFRDRDGLAATFVTGDMLEPADASLEPLDGGVDIIHAASLFHLFGWDEQVVLGERLVRFFKPDAGKAVVLGRQAASEEPKDNEQHASLGLGRYLHNLDSFQKLWDAIGERTGSRWKVDGEMIDLIPDSKELKRVGIRFAVYKVS